jgi:hypothetical protein
VGVVEKEAGEIIPIGLEYEGASGVLAASQRDAPAK